MKFVGLLLVCAALTGCQGLPSAQETASADYGEYPNNYEQIVKVYYETVAKDPDSVKYRTITTPRQMWLGNRIDGAKFGYLVCADVNAKNSYGAYTGFKRHGLLIRNGHVEVFVPNGDWWGRRFVIEKYRVSLGA